MHILLFCSSTINFGCYVNLKFLFHRLIMGENADPAITLKIHGFFLMKLATWIDSKVENMHIVLICLLNINFGCYGNVK